MDCGLLRTVMAMVSSIGMTGGLWKEAPPSGRSSSHGNRVKGLCSSSLEPSQVFKVFIFQLIVVSLAGFGSLGGAPMCCST